MRLQRFHFQSQVERVCGKCKTAVFSVLVLGLSCAHGTNPAQLLSPDDRTAVAMEFGGQSLLHPGEPSVTGNAVHGGGRLSRPSIREIDGRLCIQSQDGIYFDEELGFRFTWCSADFAGRSALLDAFLARIDDEASAALPPEFAAAGLHLEILTEKDALTLESDAEAVLVLSNDSKEPPAHAVLAYDSRIPLQKESVPRALPRRFPANEFRFFTGNGHARLTYHVTHARRLVITMDLGALAPAVRNGIHRLPEVSSRLLEDATVGRMETSEFLFVRTGGFFEAASTENTGSIVQFTLRCGTDEPDAQTYAFHGFLFPRSVLVFPCGLSQMEFVAGERRESFTKENAERFPPRRSIVSADNTLQANTDCWTTNPCTSFGIHPTFPPEADQTFPTCKTADLFLTETNPFGILENGVLDPSGKFLELSSRLTCIPGSFALKIDAEWIEPGTEPIEPGQPLVIAGSARFFDHVRVRDESSLRSLSLSSTVVLVDLQTRSETTLRFPASARVTYGGVHKSGTVFRRIHSLTGGTGDFENFHAPTSSGLRPDLAADHAMSPGRPEADPALPSDESASGKPSVRIAEILPQGSRADDGTSHPGDEFVEFQGAAGCALHSLIFQSNAGDGVRTLVLPPPCIPESGRFSVFRSVPFCFSAADSVIEPGLVLPNSSAVYTLTSGSFTDSFSIPAPLYSTMESSVRTSASRSFAAETVVLTDGPSSAALYCPTRTRATPDAAESFRPFFHFEGAAGSLLRLRFFAEDPSLSFQILLGRTESDAAVFYQGEANSGTLIEIPLPHSVFPRLLASVSMGGVDQFLAELFPRGALLVVDEVFVNPLTGSHEYVRFCSPAGFPAEVTARGFFFKDRTSEDTIVPYGDRFGSSLPGPLQRDTLALKPGQCALLVDPDTTTLPALRTEDAVLWTIAGTTALGDGLSSGEGFTVFTREGDGSISPFATFGLPGTTAAFAVDSGAGEHVRRIGATIYDLFANYEVRP